MQVTGHTHIAAQAHSAPHEAPQPPRATAPAESFESLDFQKLAPHSPAPAKTPAAGAKAAPKRPGSLIDIRV
jgi:hypothetical protein